MNYYNPNYYTGYPNSMAQYNPSSIQNHQQFVQTPQTPQQFTQPQGLNGKIVDNKEVVTVTEVPMGGYGLFPKADLSEVYIKIWDKTGTSTNIITYKPVEEPVPTPIDTNQIILEKIELLGNKLDSILNNKNVVPTQNNSQVIKEVSTNEY